MAWFVRLAVALMSLYAVVIAGMYFAQTWLLFPTTLAGMARVQLPTSTQHIEVKTPDGEVLVGVRIPSFVGSAHDAPTLVGFGGNAANADVAALILHNLFPDRDIVVFHYRGYAPSSGSPSAQALLSDSLVIFDYLRQAGASQPIVVVGFSIGSGVAAYLAQHRSVAGLILVTPFDSLTRVAASRLPFLPVRLLFRNPLEPAAELSTSRVPTAILAAGRDSLVLPERTAALRRAVPNLVFDATIAGADHNSIYQAGGFAPALRTAMAKVSER